MSTPQEIRKIRLSNDYKQMLNIQNSDVISWEAVEGAPPYVEKYRVTIRVRTIIGKRANNSPIYRDVSVVTVTLPQDYPNSAPRIVMESSPPFHPNWFSDRHWCYGSWRVGEALGDHVIRMVKTLQFDPEITNENSPANIDANNWYMSRKNSGLFPCDRTRLPDPSTPRNENKPRFTILRRL